MNNLTKGPLRTEEIEQRKHFWFTQAQESGKRFEKFGDDSSQLNLQEGREGLLECREQILGDYPIYHPDAHTYTEKLVTMSHLVTLHGRVGLTMAKLREEFWISRLRHLVKVIRQCYGCRQLLSRPHLLVYCHQREQRAELPLKLLVWISRGQ